MTLNQKCNKSSLGYFTRYTQYLLNIALVQRVYTEVKPNLLDILLLDIVLLDTLLLDIFTRCRNKTLLDLIVIHKH